MFLDNLPHKGGTKEVSTPYEHCKLAHETTLVTTPHALQKMDVLEKKVSYHKKFSIVNDWQAILL